MNEVDILNKKMLDYFLAKNIDISSWENKEFLDELMLNLSIKFETELKEENLQSICKQLDLEPTPLHLSKYYVKLFHLLFLLLENVNTKQEKCGKITNSLIKELNFSPEQSDKIFPNIDHLYYDDFLLNKKFHHMSKENKKRYEKDLKCFYISFSGRNEIPHNKSFHEICLEDLSKEENHDIHNYLLYEYGKFLRNKLKNMIELEQKLLEVLKDVLDLEKKILKSFLSRQKLDSHIKKSRKLIMNLWKESDEGYIQGMRMLENIIEDLQLKNIISQQKRILKKLERIYGNKTIPKNDLYISSSEL